MNKKEERHVAKVSNTNQKNDPLSLINLKILKLLPQATIYVPYCSIMRAIRNIFDDKNHLYNR